MASVIWESVVLIDGRSQEDFANSCFALLGMIFMVWEHAAVVAIFYCIIILWLDQYCRLCSMSAHSAITRMYIGDYVQTMSLYTLRSMTFYK